MPWPTPQCPSLRRSSHEFDRNLRFPIKRESTRAFLEPWAGQYLLGNITCTFSLEGDNILVLTVPGQPKYELVPVKGTTFDLKGLSGYSIEFKKAEGGKATEAIFYQPEGTYIAKRKP